MWIRIDTKLHHDIQKFKKNPSGLDYSDMSLKDFIYEQLLLDGYHLYKSKKISPKFKKLKTKKDLQTKINTATNDLEEKKRDSHANPYSEDYLHSIKHDITELQQELNDFRYYSYSLPVDEEINDIYTDLKNNDRSLTKTDIAYSLIRFMFDHFFRFDIDRLSWAKIMQKYPSHILVLDNIIYQKNDLHTIRFANVELALNLNSIDNIRLIKESDFQFPMIFNDDYTVVSTCSRHDMEELLLQKLKKIENSDCNTEIPAKEQE